MKNKSSVSQTRFRLLAARGSKTRGLELLSKLDAHFGSEDGQHSLHETPEPFKR